MNILVIDAQGGGIGRQVVSAVKGAWPQATVTAVGANSSAASAMLKAGADQAATGENAVVVCSRKADVIIGPVGIVPLQPDRRRFGGAESSILWAVIVGNRSRTAIWSLFQPAAF